MGDDSVVILAEINESNVTASSQRRLFNVVWVHVNDKTLSRLAQKLAGPSTLVNKKWLMLLPSAQTGRRHPSLPAVMSTFCCLILSCYNGYTQCVATVCVMSRKLPTYNTPFLLL